MGDRFRNGGLYDAKTCLLALSYALKWGLKSVPADDGFDNTASSPLNDCHGRQERFRVLECYCSCVQKHPPAMPICYFIGVAAVALILVFGATSVAGATSMSGGDISFVVTADLNGDGYDEVIIGVEPLSEVHIAEFALPGDVFVYECDRTEQGSCVLQQAFRCRSDIPELYLPGFFKPSLVSIADIDGDSLLEVAIVWCEQCWWPIAYQPISVLQFNPLKVKYELVINPERHVGEIGGYALEDVDDDGMLEILEIDPVYGTETNPVTGTQEWECHYCPHRYSVRVIEFDGENFSIDAVFNDGEVYITPGKYLPDAAWDPISGFLLELLDQISAIGRE
jgi:hypothetical protein